MSFEHVFALQGGRTGEKKLEDMGAGLMLGLGVGCRVRHSII